MDYRIKPECVWCEATQGLRVHSQDPWGNNTDFICEDCFTPQDTGPCFDDLPEA